MGSRRRRTHPPAVAPNHSSTDKLSNIELRDYLREIKENTRCYDCGAYFHHSAMDFDHRYGKVDNVSNLTKLGSLRVLQLEISKCDVVCSNCHRRRTWERQQAKKYQVRRTM